MARDYGINQNTAYGRYMRGRDDRMRADFWKKTVLPIAAFATGGAASGALMGGGAAAPAAGTSFWGGVTSPTFGAGSAATAPSVVAPAAAKWSLGSFLNSDAMGLGVNAFTSILGNRAQSRATREALAAQVAANEQAHQLQLQQLADARAAHEANQELQRRQLAASEEDRAFSRRLIEDREARLAPYRAMSERARMNLAAFLGLR